MDCGVFVEGYFTFTFKFPFVVSPRHLFYTRNFSTLCIMSVPIKTILLILITASWIFTGCASQIGPRPGYNRVTGRTTNKGTPAKKGYKEVGMISYYGPKFHGKKTANGETFNQNDITAAHRTLPFNSRVKVTILTSGKSVVVRINDRGPFKKNRILDLSKGAAKKVGLIQSGTAKAKIVVL